jgi:hypothetical protein
MHQNKGDWYEYPSIIQRIVQHKPTGHGDSGRTRWRWEQAVTACLEVAVDDNDDD